MLMMMMLLLRRQIPNLDPFRITIGILQTMFTGMWIIFFDNPGIPRFIDGPKHFDLFTNHTMIAISVCMILYDIINRIEKSRKYENNCKIVCLCMCFTILGEQPQLNRTESFEL